MGTKQSNFNNKEAVYVDFSVKSGKIAGSSHASVAQTVLIALSLN